MEAIFIPLFIAALVFAAFFIMDFLLLSALGMQALSVSVMMARGGVLLASAGCAEFLSSLVRKSYFMSLVDAEQLADAEQLVKPVFVSAVIWTFFLGFLTGAVLFSVLVGRGIPQVLSLQSYAWALGFGTMSLVFGIWMNLPS